MTAELVRYMLAHLAADWEAQAAELERVPDGAPQGAQPASLQAAHAYRRCARQLRKLIGAPARSAPVVQADEEEQRGHGGDLGEAVQDPGLHD